MYSSKVCVYIYIENWYTIGMCFQHACAPMTESTLLSTAAAAAAAAAEE